MKKTYNIISVITLILLLSAGLFAVLLAPVKGESSNVVGVWHLDEVKADGYNQVTPDATGVNAGTLGVDPVPQLVEGKFDKALQFSGYNFVYVPISFLIGFPPSPQPIYMPISPNLDINKEIRIEAWINVQDFTDATYNNIVVKCSRADAQWQNVTRIVGLAVRGGSVEDRSISPEGTLSGFVYTDKEGFNEIVTTEPVIILNQWIHVAFERTASGMHIYVNGYEKPVKAIQGVQNPDGSILDGTEIYFGHDAKVTIDEIKISDLSPNLETTEASIDIGPNLLTAVIVVSAIFAVAWLLRRALQMMVFRSKP